MYKMLETLRVKILESLYKIDTRYVTNSIALSLRKLWAYFKCV